MCELRGDSSGEWNTSLTTGSFPSFAKYVDGLRGLNDPEETFPSFITRGDHNRRLSVEGAHYCKCRNEILRDESILLVDVMQFSVKREGILDLVFGFDMAVI